MVVSPVLPAVQAEAESLGAQGVDKIILVSHLQDVAEEIELVASLSGVDVVIAGGGDDLLRNEGDTCQPGRGGGGALSDHGGGRLRDDGAGGYGPRRVPLHRGTQRHV